MSGLFEVRAQDYLDSLPGAENRGVNKFLKGLGTFLLLPVALKEAHNLFL